MFEHVEEKLKTVAVVNAVCGALCAVILFFWGVSHAEYSEGLALTGLMLGVVVILTSLISSWFMYAFAELLENTKEMNHLLKVGFAEEIKSAERAEEEQKARIATYWDSHPEEKRALETRRAEAEEKLKNLGGFEGEQRKELQDLIRSIDEKLNMCGSN